MAALYAIMVALAFAVIIGLSSGIFRTNSAERAAVSGMNFIADLVVLFIINLPAFYYGRPMMTFGGLWVILFVNLAISAIVSCVADYIAKEEGFDRTTVWRKVRDRDFSPVNWIALGLVVVMGVVGIVGYNSGHSAYRASHIVHVTQEPTDLPPASSTANIAIVPEEIAKIRAQSAMNSGEARTRGYSTYLNLGDPTQEFVRGQMQYVFPLEFDGAGNKHALHSIEPGYIMVPAQDVNGKVVENYDGMYSMKVSLGAGQGGEPDRWARSHGYASYLLDDPTLEIDDQGRPYYTVTLVRPQLGWTFMAPVGVLVIDAHTGAIKRYSLGHIPSWVDRVYSANMAEQIVNWYGMYGKAGFKGPFGWGSTNANRYHVSGKPLLVYTGDGHPDWRMLLTSFNKDSSVAYIVIMDAHSGAMRIYTPQGPMSTEEPVLSAFASASGQGAGAVSANHYAPVGLTLHVIYGHLTYMVSYVSKGKNPSFVGVGFVDAYHAVAANAVFGNSRATALGNYLTQLAVEGNANGNNPGAGAQYKQANGVISAVGWDLPSGAPKLWYIMLQGDNQHVYVGTAGVGPAIVMCKPGDHVQIRYLSVSPSDSTRTIQSFTDTDTPLRPTGS